MSSYGGLTRSCTTKCAIGVVRAVQANGSCLGYVSPIDDHLRVRLAPIRRWDVCFPLLSTLSTKGGSGQLPHHENIQALSRWRSAGGQWLRHILKLCPTAMFATVRKANSWRGGQSFHRRKTNSEARPVTKMQSTLQALIDQQTAL